MTKMTKKTKKHDFSLEWVGKDDKMCVFDEL